MLLATSSILIAYVIGSISSAYVVGKLVAKYDMRGERDGNISAAAVYQKFGRVPFILVVLMDIGLAVCAVTIAKVLTDSRDVMMLAGISTVAGHNWSLFLKFKGGKGVATGAGVFLAINPLVILVSFVIFVIVFLIWKYVSLGSLAGTAIIPLSFTLLKAPLEYILLSLLIACGVFIKHKDNIKRLFAGTENKVKF